MAAKLTSVMSNRMAMPLNSLIFGKEFSIRCHHLHACRSNSLFTFRFLLGGITAAVFHSLRSSSSRPASNAPVAGQRAAFQPLQEILTGLQIVRLTRKELESD